MDTEGPIGVFDSGVGGLSVLREIRRELPFEELHYFADSAYAPYGEQPESIIRSRALAVAHFLLDRSAKTLVVACNTATSVAVEALRAEVAVPVVAIEPAVKPAALNTKARVVGVLATRQTLAAANLSRLLAAHGTDVRILLQPCPGLVRQVEAGHIDGAETRALVEEYVLPLLQQGADTLVLGCTHYPFLEAVIRDVAGADVTIVDPSAAVARELRRRLQANALLAQRTEPGGEYFWTSGEPDAVQPVVDRLWPRRVDVRSAHPGDTRMGARPE